MKPYSESISSFGSLQGTNGTGTQAITTLPFSSLIYGSGVYRIDVYSQVTAIANASISHNASLQVGGVEKHRIIFHIVAQNSGAYQPKQPLTVYHRLNTGMDLSVNFRGNFAATETQDWTAQIVATRVSD